MLLHCVSLNKHPARCFFYLLNWHQADNFMIYQNTRKIMTWTRGGKIKATYFEVWGFFCAQRTNSKGVCFILKHLPFIAVLHLLFFASYNVTILKWPLCFLAYLHPDIVSGNEDCWTVQNVKVPEKYMLANYQHESGIHFSAFLSKPSIRNLFFFSISCFFQLLAFCHDRLFIVLLNRFWQKCYNDVHCWITSSQSYTLTYDLTTTASSSKILKRLL